MFLTNRKSRLTSAHSSLYDARHGVQTSEARSEDVIPVRGDLQELPLVELLPDTEGENLDAKTAEFPSRCGYAIAGPAVRHHHQGLLARPAAREEAPPDVAQRAPSPRPTSRVANAAERLHEAHLVSVAIEAEDEASCTREDDHTDARVRRTDGERADETLDETETASEVALAVILDTPRSVNQKAEIHLGPANYGITSTISKPT